MASIEVDFDVFKALTSLRQTEATTYNDVIRELLKLPTVKTLAHATNGSGHGWVTKGVTFPNGTEFRTTYNGKTYLARVTDNQMILDGKLMNSFSEAATYLTKNTVNGWRFWECRVPGELEWRLANTFKR